MGSAFLIAVTIVLPAGSALYACYKRRFTLFALGMLAFVLSQYLFRIPLLQYVIAPSTTYQFIAATKPLVIVAFLSLSAGVVEEIARYLLLRYVSKHPTLRDGLWFGLGHGVVEAFLIVGVHIPILTTQLAFLSGAERLLAIITHICLTQFSVIAVRKQSLRYVLYAVLLHAVVNFIVATASFTLSLVYTELVLALLVALLATLTIKMTKRCS